MLVADLSYALGPILAGLALAADPAALIAGPPPVVASEGSVQIEYWLEHDPSPGDGTWKVRLSASGLDTAQRDVTLELSDWGGWGDVDSLYLRGVHIDPPPRRAGTDTATGWSGDGARRFELQVPDDWDGHVAAEYALHHLEAGSRVHDQKPLLPFRTTTYTQAFSINTLMRVLFNGEPVRATQRVHIRAPDGMTIATGWGGVSTGRQTADLPYEVDNALIVIGKVVGHESATGDAASCEVIQFAAGPDVTDQVVPLVKSLLSAYARSAGCGLGFPVRVILNDPCGGNIGGTRTDRGLVVHVDAREPGFVSQDGFKRILAHELFHNWLGGLIAADDESTVWFSEGFTEYLALWHLVSGDHLPADWFADRLVGMDSTIREGEAYGRVAFADPGVRWRDGDGPNETFAYRGGALLAFHTDVALRQAGRAGLPQMIADLIHQHAGKLSHDTIRHWYESNGLAEFYHLYVAGRELPALSEALVSLGFVPQRREEALTYLGIQTHAGLSVGRVLAIDPDGPAAATELKVGDKIRGYYPARSERPQVDDAVDTPYRFGLERITPDRAGTYVDVLRDGRELQVPITPRIIPGGYITRYAAGGEQVRAFFEFRPSPPAHLD